MCILLVSSRTLTFNPSRAPASLGIAVLLLLRVIRPIRWSPSLDGCHVTGCCKRERETCTDVHADIRKTYMSYRLYSTQLPMLPSANLHKSVESGGCYLGKVVWFMQSAIFINWYRWFIRAERQKCKKSKVKWMTKSNLTAPEAVIYACPARPLMLTRL